MKVTPSKFLRRVWRSQHLDGTAFVTWFDEDHEWHDIHVLVRGGRPKKLRIPNDSRDCYFAPCLFRGARRRKENALPGRWLYADLDEADPRELDIKPTIAWETSKGRYQAMWRLTKPLQPDALAELNQKMTYYTQADKGGWSLTKVLRVPGSLSTKHGYEWSVDLMWYDNIAYNPIHLTRQLSETETPGTASASLPKSLKLPKASPSRILRRRKPNARARKLYKAREARGDRSARLWELENLLLKAGCTPEETLVIVRGTVWNKYQGQRRELAQLWTEINKASSALQKNGRPHSKKSRGRSQRSHSSSNNSNGHRGKRDASSKRTSKTRKKKASSTKEDSSTTNGLSSISYNDLLAKKLKKPGWLVQGVWSETAHGVLAGEAKTYKSVISTDLAVSVASGTPFLGHFAIPAVGPVLMIQEENDEGELQDRFRRIAFSRKLAGSVELKGNSLSVSGDTDLPIHVLSNQSFDLTSNKHLNWMIRQIRTLDLRLVILDPFYLMTPGIDENSAAQVGPVLKNLLKIKQALNCGILLIHHYKKQNVMAPIYGASRMSGTGVFHRWFESAVYVEKDDPDKRPFTVRMQPDHRGHAPQGVIRATFDLGTDDDLYYAVYLDRVLSDKAKQYDRLRKLLDEREDGGWSVSELRVAMGMNTSKKLRPMLKDIGWRVVKTRDGSRGRPRLTISRRRVRKSPS